MSFDKNLNTALAATKQIIKRRIPNTCLVFEGIENMPFPIGPYNGIPFPLDESINGLKAFVERIQLSKNLVTYTQDEFMEMSAYIDSLIEQETLDIMWQKQHILILDNEYEPVCMFSTDGLIEAIQSGGGKVNVKFIED